MIIIILIDCRQMAPCPLQNGITRRARNNNIRYNNNKSYLCTVLWRRGTTNGGGGGGGSPAVTCDSQIADQSVRLATANLTCVVVSFAVVCVTERKLSGR